MGIFKDEAPKMKSKAPSMPTVIATGTVITGDLAGAGDVHLDGVLRGNVQCERLTVGESGSLFGEASVETVIVMGEVRGQIRARKVSLGKTAKVYGDVDHEVLEVEAGAEVEGRYQRTVADASSEAAADDRASDAEKAQIPIGVKAGAMQREAPPAAPSRKAQIGGDNSSAKISASSEGAGRGASAH